MKNKGFTLIELLAVIIILVALTLITLPVVSNIINNAESDSELKSAKLYLEGVNLAIVNSNLTTNLSNNTCSIIIGGDLNCSGQTISVNAKNNTPVSGTVMIQNKEVVSISNMLLGNNYYNYSNGEWTNSSEPPKEPGVCVRGKEGSYDIVTCGTETFYIMYESGGNITMLAKYNLDVGRYFVEYLEDDTEYVYDDISNPTGIQNSLTDSGDYGLTQFSSNGYWNSSVNSYPAYVYNENSSLYDYVENYKDYLEGLEVTVVEARLMTLDEAEDLGCDSSSWTCESNPTPEWVYRTSYWLGTADDFELVWSVVSSDSFYGSVYYQNDTLGVRPVIVIPSSMVD